MSRVYAMRLVGLTTTTILHKQPQPQAQKKNLSYGFINKGSIKEQRESLPVYALKGQFMEAMAKNQVRVVCCVVGD